MLQTKWNDYEVGQIVPEKIVLQVGEMKCHTMLSEQSKENARIEVTSVKGVVFSFLRLLICVASFSPMPTQKTD